CARAIDGAHARLAADAGVAVRHEHGGRLIVDVDDPRAGRVQVQVESHPEDVLHAVLREDRADRLVDVHSAAPTFCRHEHGVIMLYESTLPTAESLSMNEEIDPLRCLEW